MKLPIVKSFEREHYVSSFALTKDQRSKRQLKNSLRLPIYIIISDKKTNVSSNEVYHYHYYGSFITESISGWCSDAQDNRAMRLSRPQRSGE